MLNLKSPTIVYDRSWRRCGRANQPRVRPSDVVQGGVACRPLLPARTTCASSRVIRGYARFYENADRATYETEASYAYNSRTHDGNLRRQPGPRSAAGRQASPTGNYDC